MHPTTTLHVENWLYPLLEKRHIAFSDVARIAVGLFFMALAMAYDTLVQELIHNAPPCYRFPMQFKGPDGKGI